MDWLEEDFLRDEERNVWMPRRKAGDFGYSDGDANEDYLLSVMRRAESCAVMSEDMTAAMKDWPSTYHLHHQRCNLLRPVAGLLRGPVLEIGAGCGALTRFLGELGCETLALEGSARRASIIGERCRDLPSVRVLNASFQDFRPQQRFRTILLIGVLEYARLYFGGDEAEGGDPVDRMLARIRGMLAPDGVLIVAIENQLGLKYFAGYPEDHLGVAMSGIEEHYHAASVATFGRRELAARIAAAGLGAQRFVYPFPDYKFPQAVLSEAALTGPDAPRYAELVAGAMAADRQAPGRPVFRLSRAVGPVMRNGLGGDLANSFLALCAASETPLGETMRGGAVHYGAPDRRKPYLKIVEFVDDGEGIMVRRRPLTDAPAPAGASVIQALEDEPFAEGRLWTGRLEEIMLRPGWTLEEVAAWARVWLDALAAEAGLAADAARRAGATVDGRLFDAIPKNMLATPTGEARFVDQEWRATAPVTLGFLLVRGLADSLMAVASAAPSPAAGEVTGMVVGLCGLLGVPMSRAEVRAHLAREDAFQAEICVRPGVGDRTRFVRQHLSHRGVERLDRLARKLRHLGRMLRRPSLLLSRVRG